MKTILMKIIFQLIFVYVERFYFGNSIFIINKEQKGTLEITFSRVSLSSLGILDTLAQITLCRVCLGGWGSCTLKDIWQYPWPPSTRCE